MDFENLVEPITSYLGFMLRFWTGDNDVIRQYSSEDSINPEALLLAIVGIFSYLILRYARLNLIPPDPEPLSGPGPKADYSSIILIVLTSLATPILLEVSFYILGFREKFSMSTFYATFNAGFLSIASYYPLNGVFLRTSAFATAFQKVGGRPAQLARIISLVVTFSSLVLIIWAYRPFLVVHNLTVGQAYPSILLAIAIFIVPVCIFSYFLFHWNRYILDRSN